MDTQVDPEVQDEVQESPETEAAETQDTPAAESQETAAPEAPEIPAEVSQQVEEKEVQQPEFSDVPIAASETGAAMEHLRDVPVEVSAELGRVSMTLGELLRIGEGAVIKLNRQVSAPVELIAQGVRVALADVIVVDECFAVRIRSIERSR